MLPAVHLTVLGLVLPYGTGTTALSRPALSPLGMQDPDLKIMRSGSMIPTMRHPLNFGNAHWSPLVSGPYPTLSVRMQLAVTTRPALLVSKFCEIIIGLRDA